MSGRTLARGIIAAPMARGRRSHPRPSEGLVIPDCSQTVGQAFQPVQAQAKACGYRKYPFERNSVIARYPGNQGPGNIELDFARLGINLRFTKKSRFTLKRKG